MEYISIYHSPLGDMTMASNGTALTGLWFNGQKYFSAAPAEQRAVGGLPVFEQTKQWLDIYFEGSNPDFMPLLSYQSTPFRQAVWEILSGIPYGQTITYGEIAALIAKERGIPKMSAQAVGGAVGHNAIAIIIPCHRVVGANGNLTGYAGGLEKKIALLKLEKAL